MIIKNTNDKTKVLECLYRFIGDNGEWVHGWEALATKVENYKELTIIDIEDINECLNICLGNCDNFRLSL